MSDLPAGRQPGHCTSAFTVQHNRDESVERYKARIIAHRYSQIDGLNYKQTFAPVTRHDSLDLIIALATQLGLDTDQLDIKAAFLNGDLVVEIWMVFPPGSSLDGKDPELIQAL